MKISKLFHWLYALVMLLPIFAIGSACLISTFNMSGKEEAKINYKYETNEVNSEDDLEIGNLYNFVYEPSRQVANFNISGYLVNTNYFWVENIYDIEIDETYFQSSILTNIPISVSINVQDGEYTINFYCPTSDSYVSYYFSFSYQENGNIDFDIILSSYYNLREDYQLLHISSYNIIESVETHNLNAENVFYNAIDKVTESPLFSWAYNSFLAVPIVYITNLFSIPSNHVVIELLSYWLAISVVWLCFDVIMYVPLLAHKYIDKAVIE